jgi:hypothetical protein
MRGQFPNRFPAPPHAANLAYVPVGAHPHAQETAIVHTPVRDASVGVRPLSLFLAKITPYTAHRPGDFPNYPEHPVLRQHP